MENLIFIIIFGLFLLVNALIKKAASSGEKDTKKQPSGSPGSQNDEEYRASQSDLQDFLQEVKNEKKKKSQQKSQQRRRTTDSRSGQTSAHWASEKEAEKKSRRARKIRQKQQEQQEEGSKTSSSKQKTHQATAAQSAHPAESGTKPPTLPGRAESGQRSFEMEPDKLADAVIWSEILRPPIALRSENPDEQKYSRSQNGPSKRAE